MERFKQVIPEELRICIDCVAYRKKEGICVEKEDQYGDFIGVDPNDTCGDYYPTLLTELLFLKKEAEEAERERRRIKLTTIKRG